MATVIERERDVPVYATSNDSAGWAVAAVVILAILVVGAFVWARYYQSPAQAPSTNVNLSVPSGGTQAGTTY